MTNGPQQIQSTDLISLVSETIRGTFTAHSGYNGDANNRDYGKVDVGRQRVRSTDRERWHGASVAASHAPASRRWRRRPPSTPLLTPVHHTTLLNSLHSSLARLLIQQWSQGFERENNQNNNLTQIWCNFLKDNAIKSFTGRKERTVFPNKILIQKNTPSLKVSKN